MPVPISTAHDYFLTLQSTIVKALEDADGSRFKTDQWKRDEGGGGISRYLENGPLIERGGVLFSHVQGKTLPPSASAHRRELAESNPAVDRLVMSDRFFETGLIHWPRPRRNFSADRFVQQADSGSVK